MDAVPARCPTCGTDIPAGRTRCPGCGRVFGEDNRCPHCNAIAAVHERGGAYVCAACGKPRDRRPGTFVLSGSGTLIPASVRPSAALGRAGLGGGLRVLGVLAIAGALVAGVVAAVLVPGAGGLALAAVIGIAGGGLGIAALRAGARTSSEADVSRSREREIAIVALARKSGGVLTATRVAEALRLGLAEADAALTAMADGTRVTVEVDDDGIVSYVFREIAPAAVAPPRVRVGDDAEAHEDVEIEAGAESPAAARQKEREPS